MEATRKSEESEEQYASLVGSSTYSSLKSKPFYDQNCCM